MLNKCPYCYSLFGTWTHDPLLKPEGAKYVWISETELEEEEEIGKRYFKGYSQSYAQHIVELQDVRKQLELELLEEENRTEFSSIDIENKFQITKQHIQELRDSTEKILTAFSLTKTDYFNYDEDRNHIVHPNGDKLEWTDVNLEEDKYQIKHAHIEDLRHYLFLSEYLYMFFEDNISDNYWSRKVSNTFDNSFKILDDDVFNWIQYASVDNKYMYVGISGQLRVYNKDTLALVSQISLGASGSIYRTRNDSTHVYVYIGSASTSKIVKIQKANPNVEPPLFWQVITTLNSSETWTDFAIGKNYLYLTKIKGVGFSGNLDYFVILNIGNYQLWTKHTKTMLINKNSMSLFKLWTSPHYNGTEMSELPDSFTIYQEMPNCMSVDENKIYNSAIKYTYTLDYSEGHPSGYSKADELTMAYFVTNDFELNSPWSSVKNLTETEWNKYRMLVVDEKYVFGAYVESGIFYLTAWDRLAAYAEVLKTNTLVDSTNVENPITVTLGNVFRTLATTRQYKYATLIE